MKFYAKLRSSLNRKNQGRLTRFLVHTGMKPRINKKSISPFRQGVVVFSADFEMAWAYRYSQTQMNNAIKKGLEERNNVPVLLNLFEQYHIPVTWATVGHLFLCRCKGDVNGKAHPEMLRPGYFESKNWVFQSGDWYDHDPCTDVQSDPAWYAPDLIELILKSEVNHEIGCHSFSHIDFTYKNCSKSLADSELDACLELAAKKGIKLKSMVFPGGTAGNYESLKEKGIICYRKPTRYHIDIPVVDPYGLVHIPSSLGLDRDAYGWSKEFHITMIKKYLSNTIKHKMLCHFWFHPSMDKWYLNNILPQLLNQVNVFKNSGKLQVKTMGQVAEEILQYNNKTISN